MLVTFSTNFIRFTIEQPLFIKSQLRFYYVLKFTSTCSIVSQQVASKSQKSYFDSKILFFVHNTVQSVVRKSIAYIMVL